MAGLGRRTPKLRFERQVGRVGFSMVLRTLENPSGPGLAAAAKRVGLKNFDFFESSPRLASLADPRPLPFNDKIAVWWGKAAVSVS